MHERLHTLWRRIRRAIRRQDFERQLDAELRFHIESETAALIRAGLAPDDAHRRAVAAFGGVERWRDEARETRLGNHFEILLRDLRLSARSLRRAPSYSVPAVATLALGIAAIASIASLAYDVLFRPLPYQEPARLVAVFERNIPRKRDRNVVSAAAFTAWRQRSRSIDSISGLMPASRVWQTNAGPERLSGAEVSPSLFALLGFRPMLGPGFSSTPDAREVVVSNDFWTRRLGADPTVVGKAIRLGGVPVTVVGVMPPEFVPLEFGWMGNQEFWVPMIVGPKYAQWGRFLLVAARLRPNVTVNAAERELRAIYADLRADGTVAAGWDAQLVPLTEEIIGSVRAPLYALLVACALLLVMVLTNTSLLTIAHTRRHAADRALRAVLGATRGRLVSERLTSTVLVALCGSALGVAAAAVAVAALIHFLPTDVPRLESVHFGAVAFLVAAATAALAAVVLALAPVFDERGTNAAVALQGGARLTRGGRTSGVVMAEACAAVVLAIFAALTLRSFDRLASVDVGFDPSHLMAFRIAFDTPGVEQQAAAAASHEFLARLRAIPGVVAAGRTSVRPFYQGGTATTVMPPGLGDRDRSNYPTAQVRFVDLGYFRTLGLTPLSGRLFEAGDTRAKTFRTVVNETFVDKLWPTERNVIGRAYDLRIGDNPAAEVIGVVRDVRLSSPRDEARPTVYVFSDQQNAGEEYDVLVRTSGPEATVIPAVRELAQSVVAGTPIFRVESMRQTVSGTIARERATAQLLLFFAGAALVLVSVGVYGLYAGEVARRRREIGVRIALGATSGSVVASLLARAVSRAAIGVVAGGIIGFELSRVLGSVLYGISASDPASYIAAAIAVLGAAFVATLLPALQASRVEPSVALRAE
jgi:putative ABC transport system permease protein